MGHCDWALSNDALKAYHDCEWGVPVRGDDRQMFEHLTLECLQCGLSWGLMMKKRDIFRRCFENFDYDKVAAFGDGDVRRILDTDGMLRSERKIRAVINNARRYQEIRAEYGSFCDYLWGWTGGRTLLYSGHAQGAIPVSNGLSEDISRDLKRRGFKFVGHITIYYSHLQACGVINDHAWDCPQYERINRDFPTATAEPDWEVGVAGGGNG